MYERVLDAIVLLLMFWSAPALGRAARCVNSEATSFRGLRRCTAQQPGIQIFRCVSEKLDYRRRPRRAAGGPCIRA